MSYPPMIGNRENDAVEKASLMDYLGDSSKTRLLLAVDTSLFRELLSDLLSDEMDIQIVGQAADPIELLTMVGETSADVVVLSWPDSGELPEICTHLFAEYPSLEILGVSSGGDSVFRCRQRISITHHSSADLDQMINIIRNPDHSTMLPPPHRPTQPEIDSLPIHPTSNS